LARRYVILGRAGKGGMGAVYQVKDTRIPGKTWAIKEMSDAAITNPLDKQRARAAFRQEALMLASLDHPNLPKVTDHFSEGGRQYLVMDFIEGETVADLLDREYGKPLAVDTVLEWAVQLCNVLEYLHNQDPPVIFRDLKPSNVMLTSAGMVKLIDFGIARIFKPGKATDTAYFGTAGYCPREQYGRGQTDARSDVYALGALLHHLLTGVDPMDQPFHFEDVQRLNNKVPIHVADAVMKALSDDPAGRWQSISEMKAKLLQQPPPPAASESPQPRPSESRSRVSAPSQPALVAAAEAGAAAASQPVPVATTSRLRSWRGLGLILLGTLLFVASFWLTGEMLWDYDLPLTALLTGIPALFGVLFGPWIGGCVGALGFIACGALTDGFGDATWGFTLAHSVPGVLLGLLVKDARSWKATFGAGIVASGVYALAVAATIGIVDGWWGEFGQIAFTFLIAALPSNLLIMPLAARWLMRPVSRRGLYWRDIHHRS
jgi:serine/threonine-protein kinase